MFYFLQSYIFSIYFKNHNFMKNFNFTIAFNLGQKHVFYYVLKYSYEGSYILNFHVTLISCISIYFDKYFNN